MAPIDLILWVFAFVFFCVAMLGVPNPPRLNFLGAGLACIALAEIIGRAGPIFTH